MGNVADFSKYKARRDYAQNLVNKGWMPDRIDKAHSDGISIYIYDDYTQLLLFSNVQQSSLEKIIHSVTHAEEDNLLTVADKLGALITDFGLSPPYQGDQRLSAIAQTAIWFAGFSLSLINSKTLLRESLAIFRLVDIEQQACTFHLAHLAWPEVMERSSAASYLAGMAKQLRRELFSPR